MIYCAIALLKSTTIMRYNEHLNYKSNALSPLFESSLLMRYDTLLNLNEGCARKNVESKVAVRNIALL
jgi:hypothetical protein